MPKPRRTPKPTAAKRRSTGVAARSAGATARRALHYKVVELSNVDEGALERTLNEWVPHGWTFDGVQFAMRESSKRPAMAFVFFTREGEVLREEAPAPVATPDAFRPAPEAEAHLRRIAREPVREPPAVDPWARLRALAGEEDQDEALRIVSLEVDQADGEDSA